MSFGTLLTKLPRVLRLAWAFSCLKFTDTADRAIQVTVTRFTIRESGVSVRALFAIRLLEVGFAEAISRPLGTGSIVESFITSAWLTDVLVLKRTIRWTVKLVLALVTIDALRVVLAIGTDTAAVQLQFGIQGQFQLVNRFIVDT